MLIFSENLEKGIYRYTPEGFVRADLKEVFRFILSGGTLIAVVSDTADFKEWLRRNGMPLGGVRTFSYLNYAKLEGLQQAFEFTDLMVKTGIFSQTAGVWHLNSINYSKTLLSRIDRYDRFLRVERDADIPHINGSFYGGRTEEYRTDMISGLTVNYDINSAYAYVLSGALPDVSTERRVGGVRMSDLEDPDVYFIVYAKVETGRDTYVPAVPFKVEGNGKENQEEDRTFFACGEVEGWFSGFDVLSAYRSGAKVSVLDAYLYRTKVYPVLSETVNHMYRVRKNLGGIYKDFLKSQMVRLYGLISLSEDWLPRNRLIGSYVTAKTRYILYSIMKKLEKKLVYADTDSVIAFFDDEKQRQEFEKTIPLGDRLGEFGIRGEYSRIKVYGGKRYAFTEKGSDMWQIKIAGTRITDCFYDPEEDSVLSVKPFTGEHEVIYLPDVKAKRVHLPDGRTSPFYVSGGVLCQNST